MLASPGAVRASRSPARAARIVPAPACGRRAPDLDQIRLGGRGGLRVAGRRLRRRGRDGVSTGLSRRRRLPGLSPDVSADVSVPPASGRADMARLLDGRLLDRRRFRRRLAQGRLLGRRLFRGGSAGCGSSTGGSSEGGTSGGTSGMDAGLSGVPPSTVPAAASSTAGAGSASAAASTAGAAAGSGGRGRIPRGSRGRAGSTAKSSPEEPSSEVMAGVTVKPRPSAMAPAGGSPARRRAARRGPGG